MRLPNLPKIEFDQNIFYNFGIACFVIIALGNLWSLFGLWEVIDWGLRVSKTFGIVFNFVIARFFLYLKGTQQPQQNVPSLSDEDMTKALEKIS